MLVRDVLEREARADEAREVVRWFCISDFVSASVSSVVAVAEDLADGVDEIDERRALRVERVVADRHLSGLVVAVDLLRRGRAVARAEHRVRIRRACT